MRGQARGQAGRGRSGAQQQQQGSGQRQLPHAQTSSEAVRRPGQPATATPSTSGGRGVQHHSERGDASGVQSLGRGLERLTVSGDGGGDAGALQPSRRGMSRGKRTLPVDILNTRPTTLKSKKGTSGQTIMLHSNYFKFLKLTDWAICQYRVDFLPEEDNTSTRKKLLKVHSKYLGNYIFDGTVLFSSVRFPKEKMVFTSKRETDDQIMTINVRLVGDMMLGDAHYIQFFNIIMRKCYEQLNLVLIGRNYFDKSAAIQIPSQSMEVWPGYISSIRQHENHILMCVEITSKVMRNESVYEIYKNIRNRFGDRCHDAFCKAVINTVVLTKYNNRTYTIDDVEFNKTPAHTFVAKDGEKQSYIDYYQRRYGRKIVNMDQPLLVAKSKLKVRQAGPPDLIYLIPELCNTTGLTDEMRENYKLMAALAEHTRLTPEHRIEKLLKFNKRLYDRPAIIEDFTAWNLQLDTKLVEIPGRILPSETLTFGPSLRESGQRVKRVMAQNGDWSKEMPNTSCLTTMELRDWVVVTTERDRKDSVENFISKLQQVAKGVRFIIAQPSIYTIPDDRAGTFNTHLEYVLSKKIPQLVFCVAPNNRNDRYSVIKKKCCVDRPVPSQVCLTRTLKHRNIMTIATKIAIQMNCKLGGAPWTVDVPLEGLMIIGFDVSHDTMDKSKDFGAMVASLDKQLTKYFSTVSAHSDGDELSKDLCTNVCRAVQEYAKVNSVPPNRIVVYRDGVGEGQIHQVMEREVKEIRKALDKMYRGPKYKFAFIIVTKRLNTRLFHNKQNPKSGTVVDDIITDPLKYDFFIVSQQVQQGTVTPTSYNIIDSDLGLDPDKMQRLTYKLTHMYFNCSNTVRVPAPCHYAHKLAFLISRYVHKAPENALQHKLYFL